MGADSTAAICGFALIDKPKGWTSHDVVARARRVLGVRRIGHAGTLDPMATGVLVLGVGRATRLLGLISGADKTYEATIRLGLSTTTDDIEGEVLARASADHLPLGDVLAAMAPLTGDILQRPSSVSAVKVDGKRAHALVRAGEQVVLEARPVRVEEFDLLGARPGPDGSLDLEVQVRCGSGTYIRALARDLGAALGVGGALTELRRTEAAGVDESQCRSIEDFAAEPRVVPMAGVLAGPVPLVPVGHEAVVELSHGRRAEDPSDSGQAVPGPVAAVGPDGEVVAIVHAADGMLLPDVVLIDPVAAAPGAPGAPGGPGTTGMQ